MIHSVICYSHVYSFDHDAPDRRTEISVKLY